MAVLRRRRSARRWRGSDKTQAKGLSARISSPGPTSDAGCPEASLLSAGIWCPYVVWGRPFYMYVCVRMYTQTHVYM